MRLSIKSSEKIGFIDGKKLIVIINTDKNRISAFFICFGMLSV